MTKRCISQNFINELLDGRFSDLLLAVKDKRNRLSLEIRENAINIYYRGGSLLKITESEKGDFKYKFDTKYCKRRAGESSQFYKELQSKKNKDQIEFYISNLNKMMDEMDGWFEEHHKCEREYQHYMSLDNDNVLDIEYAIEENGLRMDMIMFVGNELFLIENKYGNSAISSKTMTGDVKPGLRKHYGDFVKVLTNETLVDNLLSSMNSIYKVKQQLGLVKKTDIEFGKKSKIHVVFVLANLGLSENSKIIPNEREAIRKDFNEEILNKYPPMVLLTEKDVFKVDLSASRDFMNVKVEDYKYSDRVYHPYLNFTQNL